MGPVNQIIRIWTGERTPLGKLLGLALPLVLLGASLAPDSAAGFDRQGASSTTRSFFTGDSGNVGQKGHQTSNRARGSKLD